MEHQHTQAIAPTKEQFQTRTKGGHEIVILVRTPLKKIWYPYSPSIVTRGPTNRLNFTPHARSFSLVHRFNMHNTQACR